MNNQLVIIIATERSGSTTLMRILNTIDKSNICGENYACIEDLINY